MAFTSRLRALFRRKKLAREVDEELAFHLSMREQWNAERGMAAEDAKRASRLRFGNPMLWRERMSEIDLALLPQTVLQDLRYGSRLLLRNSGFTLAAVMALALGIGVNTATFTAYKAFFVRALEARDPASMANLAIITHSGDMHGWISYSDYVAYRDHLRSFSGVIAQYPDHLTLSGAGETVSQRSAATGSIFARWGLFPSGVAASNAEFASTFVVSENYFQVLRIEPIRGRTFAGMSSAELAGSPAVLISENYWQRRFGGDPNLLGRNIRLNGIAFTVIGITPHDFSGTSMDVPDFWMPFAFEPLIHPGDHLLTDRENECCRVFGRLAHGVTMGQAQAEMTLLADRLRAQHDPHSELSKPLTAMVWPGSPFPRKLDAGLQFAIALIMIAVGMVLVIACANVACLQLARAASRQGELGMRLSLGASRVRLIRQLLTESALLGVAAGAIALLFSWAMLRAGVAAFTAELPAEYGTLTFNVNPDVQVFAYVFGISVLAGILFGLAPALESSRSALSSALKANTDTSPARKRRMRDLLIAAQVAVSLVLMIAGGLLIHSSIRALTLDTGYDVKNALSVQLHFPDNPTYPTERKTALYREVRSRLAALPGVTDTTSGRAPDGGGVRSAAISLNGEEPNEHNTQAWIFYSYVQSNYLHALGIPILYGRGFDEQGSQSAQSVIVSESVAKELWPGQNPIGHRLRMNTDRTYHDKGELLPDGPAYEVIGVARDTRGVQIDNSDAAQVYVPLPANRLEDYPILIRTSGDPAQMFNSIGTIVTATDPNLVADTNTLEQLLRTSPPFVVAALSAGVATIVGLMGLLLASMGIYGTVSYMVVLRTREVGIRMALGAKKGDVLRLMMRESARPVLIGLAAGVVLSMGASYLLRGVLYGVNRLDGISFGGVSMLFLVIAFVATWLPSRRATRVQPMSALRCE